ncbi:MAG: hypothetical protein WBE46_04345 [Dehalococcoidia bacterium]
MEAGQIIVKQERGVLVVIATGKTPGGQKFVKGRVPLKVKDLGDPKFKEEMRSAVVKLLGSEA